MLEYKVKRFLLDNEFSKTRPLNMTQLAAVMEISDKHLRTLMRRGRLDDVERIAKGLGIEPAQLV